MPPIAPLAVIAPKVFNVKLDEFAVVALSIELKLIIFAMPVPTVNVLPLASVVAPKLICPVDVPPMFVVSTTLTLPRLIMPVPAAEIVPSTLTCEGAVAVTPPVNALVLPVALLRVSAPVLANVVLPAMTLLAPRSETL